MKSNLRLAVRHSACALRPLILITNKTMKLFYWGRLRGLGGEAACDAVHTFPARRRRGGAVRRNKKLFKVFCQKTV